MSDYVIVGAGSAGCVLAARLTEDPAARVTLIEAGGPDSAQEIHIPAALGQLFRSQYDWDYLSQPEPGLDGRCIYLPRGKTLGGSSSINAMIYIRGNRADYDGWATEGAKGWSYNEVLPYFRRAEANERGEDQFHGKFGPLSVSEGRSKNRLMDAFVRAGVEAGYPANPDFNGESQEGVGLYQCTQRNGMRCSTAVAYLHPAANRSNLEIVTDAVATRILFDGARASGVEIARYGRLEQVHADTAVILAGGAYNSPQLLMLSGIGPATDLAALRIPVRCDLPVGLGLQDHPTAWLSWYTDTEGLLTAGTAENAALLQAEGRGPLSSNLAEAGGFFRTSAALEAPDIQFHAIPAMRDIGPTPPTAHAVTFGPCLLKPRSRGKLSLRTTNPFSKPRILHNYYVASEDRESMIEGVRIGLEIAAQASMRAHITRPYTVPKSDSGADVWEYIQENTATTYHPTSTCGRQRTESIRRRRVAGGRRFGDAERGARQHERADDHDRGTRGRSDSRRHRMIANHIHGANNSCGWSRPLSWCRPSEVNGFP